jgi:hypothetical protein
LGPGGSIPVPDGFTGTVIGGNVTTIWNNGVVSFEVDYSQGVTAGSGVKTAIFQTSGGSVGAGPTGTSLTFTTITSASFVTNNTSFLTLSSGLYLLTVGGGSFARTSTSGESTVSGYIGSATSSNETVGFGFQWVSGETTVSRHYFTGCIVARFPDGNSQSQITGFMQKTGSTTVIGGPFRLGISKL